MARFHDLSFVRMNRLLRPRGGSDDLFKFLVLLFYFFNLKINCGRLRLLAQVDVNTHFQNIFGENEFWVICVNPALLSLDNAGWVASP